MDINDAFHPIFMPDFVDVFLVKATTTQHKVYLTGKPLLDVEALAPPPPLLALYLTLVMWGFS